MKKTFMAFAGFGLTAALLVFSSCKKDNNNNTPTYTVPTTYTFTNADSLTAKTTLSMIAEIEAAINFGNTSGNVVSNTKLKGMFANTGGYFTDTTIGGTVLHLNTSPIQLKSGTTAAAQTWVEILMDSIGIASQTGLAAANGQAGVSTRKTLLSAHGIYYRQFFTKTIMGAIIGHQIADVYLGDSLNSSISIAAKQHAWDNAFYLWCVPANFPTNRAGVKYWGSYTSQIDSGIVKPVVSLTGINANNTLMNAFLKGRAALANNDNATAVKQAAIIIPFFETMEAAAALHELNEAKGNLPNGAAAVAGNLSESLGFWTALKFNAHKKISDADYNAVLALYGTNFYTITPTDIDAILNKISSIYGWDAVKGNLLNNKSMKKYKVLITAGSALLFIVIAVVSCSKSGSSSQPPPTGGGKDSVLENLGTNLIVTSYQGLAGTTATLDVSVTAFVAAPSLTTLTAVQKAFKDAYKSWAACSEFEFGPATDKFLTTHFTNAFPTDTAIIKSNINGAVYSIDGLGNFAAQGFPALDYLLFAYGNDAVLARFTTDGHAAGARTYLTALFTALKTKAAAVYNAWAPSGGNYLATFINGTGVDAGSSLSLLLNAYVQDWDVNLQNYKVGIPIGIYGPSTLPKSPAKVEAYYSALSVQLLIAQVQAYLTIYQGAAGAGLDAKVAATKVQKNGVLLSDAIATQINAVLTKFQALPETLTDDIMNNSTAVTEAFTEIRKLTVLLKVDMSSALGIKISFQDDDGD